MFGDIEYALRNNLRDREYAEEYAASFLNAHVATQIKVIREQRGMTQAGLGSRIGTTQAGISRCEDVNYSSWSLRTLMKLARAFDVRLRVSFEPYGTLPDEVIRFDRARLETVDREHDPGLAANHFKSEVDSDRLVNIGAYKALAGIGQGKQEDIGGRAYGGDSGREGKSPRNDGIGRANERREGSAIGLYSAIG
jgi:transcriptional regulator with XRE-family HTH domain